MSEKLPPETIKALTELGVILRRIHNRIINDPEKRDEYLAKFHLANGRNADGSEKSSTPDEVE